MRNIIAFLFFLIIFSEKYCFAEDVSFKGQASAWLVFDDESQVGLRYLPEMSISRLLDEGKNIDAEISVNLFGWAPFDSFEDVCGNSKLKLYRAWLRYSAQEFEVRAGLQKINFGPGRILRSLRWFDQIDPRDPLQLTDGVYGLLGRYYFINNMNIWLWMLYGNDKPKGLEIIASDDEKVEFGGRYQFPVPAGEAAFSYNRRFVDKGDINRELSESISDGSENRFALDGFWDIGPGLWIEAAAGEIRKNPGDSFWQKFLTAGADYTFDIGPGIHVLYEHFISDAGTKFKRFDRTRRLSAVSIDFSISMLDMLNPILYYDWDKNEVFSYFNWQRTYDNWMLNVSLFSGFKTEDVFGGTGVQCLVTYNH